MAEVNPQAGQRDRSPAFPVIPLDQALERLAQFEGHFKRTSARPEKIGEAWTLKNRAHFDRITAALRYFGLLEYQGNGDARSVVVSELGRRYLRTQQDETKRQIVREIALKPKQIAIFWNQWGYDRPADAACLDHLMDNGFSEGGARDFLKVYDSTIAYAKPKSDDKALSHEVIDPGDDEDQPKTPEMGDLVQVEIGGALQLPQAARVRAIQNREGSKWVFVEGSETGIPMEQVIVEQKGIGTPKVDLKPPILALPDQPPAKGARKEVFALEEGDVVLTFPENLSAESFADLDAYLKVFIGKMRRRAGVPSEQ